jgi:hypothetical protein
MFGFGKKKKTLFTSKVMMTRAALDQTLVNGIRTGNILLITFFPSTEKGLLRLLGGDPVLAEFIIPAGQGISPAAIQKIKDCASLGAYKPVLAERYPLSEKEKQLADKLEMNGISLPVDAYAALDDAFMLQAGGEKIKSLMERMDMQQDEILSHTMIESSIERFQEKLAGKLVIESRAQSAQDWFRMNIPS